MNRSNAGRCAVVAVAVAIVTACGDMPTRPVVGSPATASRTIPINAFGISSRFPSGGQPCTDPEYHQFDFWIGSWDAYRTDINVLSGTDVITSRLGGCAIEENWNDGSRGRSLTAWDASTRKWTQFWVAQGGGPFTPLLLEGEFTGDRISMRYDRTSESGVLVGFPPPGVVRHQISDAYQWIPDESGSLFQLNRRSFDGGAPFLAFLLRYDAVPSVTPIPSQPGTVCESRAENRQFDFMIGDWQIYPGAGSSHGVAQAKTKFTKDVSGCLIEENMSDGPYSGWSFNSWSVVTRQWHRTFVDNEGHRIALAGGLAGGAMVMTGTVASPSKPMMVRVTWRSLSADKVVQAWEFSRDGGATWPQRHELTYVRQ